MLARRPALALTAAAVAVWSITATAQIIGPGLGGSLKTVAVPRPQLDAYVDSLIAKDDNRDGRQIGVIGLDGRSAQHSRHVEGCPYTGTRSGPTKATYSRAPALQSSTAKARSNSAT